MFTCDAGGVEMGVMVATPGFHNVGRLHAERVWNFCENYYLKALLNHRLWYLVSPHRHFTQRGWKLLRKALHPTRHRKTAPHSRNKYEFISFLVATLCLLQRRLACSMISYAIKRWRHLSGAQGILVAHAH